MRRQQPEGWCGAEKSGGRRRVLSDGAGAERIGTLATEGWRTGPSLDRELAFDALEQALATRQPEPGLIHHSDHGVQYGCGDYRRRLDERGLLARVASRRLPGGGRRGFQVVLFPTVCTTPATGNLEPLASAVFSEGWEPWRTGKRKW